MAGSMRSVYLETIDALPPQYATLAILSDPALRLFFDPYAPELFAAIRAASVADARADHPDRGRPASRRSGRPSGGRADPCETGALLTRAASSISGGAASSANSPPPAALSVFGRLFTFFRRRSPKC